MSSHGYRPALAAPLLLAGVLTGAVGCSDASGGTGTPPSATTSPTALSAGHLLDARDPRGHRYREVPERGAPQVGIVVQPDTGDTGDGWNVRLTLRRFRFSSAGRAPGTIHPAVAGRGAAELSLDGKPLALLYGPGYHLPARLASRGTHQLTACLHADDGTVWAVDGKPIQSTAALTVSDAASGTRAGGADGVGSTR